MDQPQPRTAEPTVHVEPLRWIGAYKLAKGVLALIAALMVLRLMHRDLPTIASHWLSRLRIDPHSALGDFVLKKVIALHGRNLQWVAFALFGYVVIAGFEGIGLILRRTWAEWLTVVTTAAMIPLEVLEITRRSTWVRVTILLLNIAVVVYLVWRIRRDQHRRACRAALLQNAAAADQKGRG